MRKLSVSASVSDHMLMRGMEKVEMENYVKREMAHKLADELVKSELFEKSVIERKDRFNPFVDETIFTSTVVLATTEDMKELEELRKLKKEMQNLLADKVQPVAAKKALFAEESTTCAW